MTRKFKFVGDEPVDVPALRLRDFVQPGQVVEADGAVADGLEGQSIWEPVKAAKKSADSRSDNDNPQEG